MDDKEYEVETAFGKLNNKHAEFMAEAVRRVGGSLDDFKMTESAREEKEGNRSFTFRDVDFNIRRDGDVLKIEQNIRVQMQENFDKAIVDEIIRGAKEQGITDMVLLDKEFIMEALKEKADREENVGFGKWISVKDKLPEQNVVVLVYCFGLARQGNKKALAILNNGFWLIGDCTDCMSLTNHQLKVTHWMPLPELPKGE